MFNSNNGGNGFSLSDIAAVLKGNGDGDGILGGNGITAIILLIIVMAFFGRWNGNGDFGGNGGGGSSSAAPYIYPIVSSMTSSADTSYLSQGIRDLTGAVANDFQTLNTGILGGICDIQGAIASSNASTLAAMNNGFAAQTLASVNNTNAIQRDIFSNTVGNMQNTQAITAQLAQMASDSRADTAQIAYNQATDTCAVTTNAANNTRDIIDAITTSNRAVLDAMAQNKVEAMQDKIADLQSQLQTANFLASQANQNAYLVDELGQKAPIPCYVVQNPNGCNCGHRYGGMVNA